MEPTSPNKLLKTEENANSDDNQQKLGIMKLNDHKAGMEGLDTDKINQIIESASKGSKFYLHKQKSQERIDKKILELKSALAKLTEDQRAAAMLKVIVETLVSISHWSCNYPFLRWITTLRNLNAPEIYHVPLFMLTWMLFMLQ